MRALVGKSGSLRHSKAELHTCRLIVINPSVTYGDKLIPVVELFNLHELQGSQF